MMRVPHRQFATANVPSWIALAALSAAAVAMAPLRAAGQGGFGGPGGLNSIPSTLFGQKNEAQRDVSGPSLSATDEPVAEIRIVGNKTVPTAEVLNQLKTRVGRPFDPALVQKDVRQLNSRGWFVDVQPAYEQTAAGRVVIFRVFERPIIRYIQYIGNEKIADRKLAKETDLQMGGPVDPYVVEDARRRLLDLYRRNGFNDAQVNILEGNKPTDQGVVFVINEGIAQKIWRVVFEGANFVSGRRLKTQIESKPPMLYVFKGFLDREQLDADVERLTAYYRSFGFFQARVGYIPEYRESGKWVTIRFVVYEGPRYQVQDVVFEGNQVFADSSLAMDMKLPRGEPFEQAKMNADLRWLKDLYGSQGYVFADIQPNVIYLEEPGQLRLVYHVEEGRQWRVGRIFVHISGDSPHTRRQTALNRLSIRPGQVVDTRELRASEIRLQRSGLFLVEPARGITPKITYQIQDLDAELASGDSGGFRGQSPDEVAGSREPATAGLRQGAGSSAGPLLIAPPGAWSAAERTYEVPTPPGFTDRDDQIDIHLRLGDGSDLDDRPVAAGGSPASGSGGSPAPQRYEVHRPPYEDNGPPPTPTAVPGAPQLPQSSVYARFATQGNAYQQLDTQATADEPPMIVRGQNPNVVQASWSPWTAERGGTTNPQPAVSGYYGQYPAPGYGGQAVGATGPVAATIGHNPYAMQQAAISAPQAVGPQITPTQYTVPAAGAPPAGAPVFGPPPLPPPQQYGPQPIGSPQPLGTPQTYPPFGPPPPYGTAPVLVPDPNIRPVPPLPTNPQLFPSTPVDPFTPAFTDPLVDLNVVVSEAQTGRLMLGVAVNSDAGLVGQILLDEQNFNWLRYPRSVDDFLSGRAWRGGGQRFRLEAAPGTEVQRYLASFQEPYLLDYPISLGLSGSFFDRRYLDYDEQRIGGRVSVGYQWTENDVSAVLSYRAENVNIRNISTPGLAELDDVKGSNSLHGFKLTIANDTRDSAFLATQGHYLELSFEQVIGSFDYPRAEMEARQYFLLHERPDHSGRHVLTGSTQLGFSGQNTPIYENFFAGGFTSLRGWDFRGASPVKSGVQVGGEFKWVNTIEYLFPLTADDMMHGVVFTDFGTVEENVKINDFRASVGFGLRITVPAMGPAPIALDFAWPIRKADFDDTQVFSFFVGFNR